MGSDLGYMFAFYSEKGENEMKKLKIYTENSEFVIENINSFGYGTKYFFLTENEMKEFLNPYITVIDQYKLEISGELWGMILNYLSDKKVSEQ